MPPPLTPTYTPHFRGVSSEYFNETMTYHIEVPFNEVAADGESLIGSNNILADFEVNPDSSSVVVLTGSPVTSYDYLPGVLTINAAGTNVTGGVWEQQVPCFICHRRFEEIGSTGTRRVIATYEGRVLGVHTISSRTQMIAMPIYQSLRPSPDGTFQGIGADFSGTTRDVPLFVFSVIQCVSLVSTDGSNLYDQLWPWGVLAGSVNESGWKPPWEPGSVGYLEGTFLYLGATECQPDKRTRTAMVRHDFVRMTSRAHQGIYLFYDFDQWVNPTTYRLERHYHREPVAAYVQLVAGVDENPITGDMIPIWNDANLGFNAFGQFASPMLEG